MTTVLSGWSFHPSPSAKKMLPGVITLHSLPLVGRVSFRPRFMVCLPRPSMFTLRNSLLPMKLIDW